MSEKIDPKSLPIRCRRLGHHLTLDYCLREGGPGQPCRLVRDCWWEKTDIEAVLREHLSDVEIQALNAARMTPPDKMGSLLEIIEAAKIRTQEAREKAETEKKD